MANTLTNDRSREGAQDIEQLKKRYTELDRKKAAADANLKNAQDQLEALKKQAREMFGTDDLEQLRGKLDAMKAENQRKRQEYQKHLDEIERRLGEVESTFTSSKTASRLSEDD